jgi:protein-tyrosine phosphatase
VLPASSSLFRLLTERSRLQPDVYWIADIHPIRLAIMPRPRSGDWLPDEIDEWVRQRIGAVVSLIERHEVVELGLQTEAALCAQRGIEFLSFPIADRGTPSSVRDVDLLVDGLVTRLRGNVAVAIHCRAGIGRSGLIAGCVLLKLGMQKKEIFQSLTRARGVTVPDTADQIEWLNKFAKTRNQTSESFERLFSD